MTIDELIERQQPRRKVQGITAALLPYELDSVNAPKKLHRWGPYLSERAWGQALPMLFARARFGQSNFLFCHEGLRISNQA